MGTGPVIVMCLRYLHYNDVVDQHLLRHHRKLKTMLNHISFSTAASSCDFLAEVDVFSDERFPILLPGSLPQCGIRYNAIPSLAEAGTVSPLSTKAEAVVLRFSSACRPYS